MDFSKTIRKDSLHHAYVIEGGSSLEQELLSHLASLGLPVAGHSNFFYKQYDSFAIADSRELKEYQNQKGADGDQKIFLLSITSFTHDALQALLKVFEEPTAGTHFFVLIPDSQHLLPTFLSRVILIKNNARLSLDKEAGKFIQAGIPERLNYATTFITKHEDKDRSAVLKEFAIAFVKNVESYLWSKRAEFLEEQKNIFDILDRSRSYLHQQGSSVKIILEHLALVLPVLKK